MPHEPSVMAGRAMRANTNLQETDYILCFRCREPLNKIDIESVRYKIDEFCPYCYDDVIQRKIK